VPGSPSSATEAEAGTGAAAVVTAAFFLADGWWADVLADGEGRLVLDLSEVSELDVRRGLAMPRPSLVASCVTT